MLAKQLASLGAKLIISARNEAELQRVKKQLTGLALSQLCFPFLPLLGLYKKVSLVVSYHAV